MKNLYAEDIVKYTETKGCPSDITKQYLDVNSNSIDLNQFETENSEEYHNLKHNVVECNSSFFTDSDTQGCCYSTSTYNNDNSMGIKLKYDNIKYNLYHKYDVQNLFNNLLDDPNNILLNFCAFNKVITVLKGPVTRICDGETVIYNTQGGPVLSRGGSGDILAGLIGAMIAQNNTSVPTAVARGLMLHGLAAQELAREKGQVAVHTTQLLDYLPKVLRA